MERPELGEGALPGKTYLADASKAGLALAVLIFCIAVIAAPFGLLAPALGEVVEGSEGALDVLSRLAALLAVSFIFLDMMSGSFRPVLSRVFKPGLLQSAHTTFGLAGLSLAVAHFLLLIPKLAEEWGELNRLFFLLGPLALLLLSITVFTALAPGVLKRSWRRVHLLNYFVFAFATIHGLIVGEDGKMLATRLVFGFFLGLALAGFAYRVTLSARTRRAEG